MSNQKPAGCGTLVVAVVIGLGIAYYVSVSEDNGSPPPAARSGSSSSTPAPAPREEREKAPSAPEAAGALTLAELLESPELTPGTVRLTVDQAVEVMDDGRVIGERVVIAGTPFSVVAVAADGTVEIRNRGDHLHVPHEHTNILEQAGLERDAVAYAEYRIELGRHEARKALAASITADKEREEKIRNQFRSRADGRHAVLPLMVQQFMHDPDSFRHVRTQYVILDEGVFVTMQYRGTNAFGGVITNTTSALFDDDGKLVEWVKP